MKIAELRRREASPVELHARLTVLTGLAAAGTVADELRRALAGGPSDLALVVEHRSGPVPLTRELAADLGLDRLAGVAVLDVGELPGARRTPAPDGRDEERAAALAQAEAAVTAAESQLHDARQGLQAAEGAHRAVQERLGQLPTAEVADADQELAAAEARLEVAQAAAAAARRSLAAAEDAAGTADSERAGVEQRIGDLQRRREELTAQRDGLLTRLQELPDPADPAPVMEAVAALRRLQDVKPKPSEAAIRLADELADLRLRLASMPQPPLPPEWLAAPALAALQEARDAVARAQAGAPAVEVDRTLVDAVEVAHRQVLEAEQRVMKKATRANRKRLDEVVAEERQAVQALGCSTYNEYLQRIAPSVDEGKREQRLAEATAALADAEAVWSELHGGDLPPGWTELRERQLAVRAEAVALLGGDPGDEALEEVLRSHVVAVVDTGWAQQALLDALESAGLEPGDDPVATADAFVAEAPGVREERAQLQHERTELDGRLSIVEAEIESLQDSLTRSGGPEPVEGALHELTDAVRDAEQAEREADQHVTAVRRKADVAERSRRERSELEADLASAAADRKEARQAFEAAERALDDARRSVDEARTAAASPATGGAGDPLDLSGVGALEAQLVLLARLAALRAGPAAPVPLLLTGPFARLSDVTADHLLGLLDRAADTVQVAVVADDPRIVAWIERQGSDRAALRSA